MKKENRGGVRTSLNKKLRIMKTTMTFTTEHESELNRIASLNVFASKIAQTILSREIYIASSKQVDILNEVSEITFYIEDRRVDEYMANSRYRQAGSSLR